MAAERARHSAAEDALLMHVAVAQANARMQQMRQCVLTVGQVRDACCSARASYHARLPHLVSLRIAEEVARREYM